MGTQQSPWPLLVKAAQCHHIGFNPLQLVKVRVVNVPKVPRNSKLLHTLVLQAKQLQDRGQ